MVLPSQSIRILDPSLGLVTPGPTNPVVMGVSSATLGLAAPELRSYSQITSVRADLGYGDLAETVARILREAGGPVLAILSPGSIAATKSTVFVSAVNGVDATLAGDATMRASVLIEVLTGGVLGTASFRYSLDAYAPEDVTPTWSRETVMPVGGVFVIPNLGITVTFDDGGGAEAFVSGDTLGFTCEPAQLGSTDYAACFALIESLPSLQFPLVISASRYATQAEGETAFLAMASGLLGLFNQSRFARGIVDGGSGDTWANVLAAAADFADVRVGPCYGDCLISSVLPFEAFGTYRHSGLIAAAARACRVLISTSLARVAEGNLGGVSKIYFDSTSNDTIDNAGFITLRTWQHAAGFYVAGGRLKAPFGSDYQYLQYGRVIDEACRVAFAAGLPYVEEGFRTVADTGAIDPLDAADIQTSIYRAVSAAILEESNARGAGGHASDIDVEIDQTNNFAATGALFVNIGVQPLGYAHKITQTIGLRVLSAE